MEKNDLLRVTNVYVDNVWISLLRTRNELKNGVACGNNCKFD